MSLGGSAPSELGQLDLLGNWGVMLSLDGNSLAGAAPTEVVGKKSLCELWLAESLLPGPAPAEIGAASNAAIADLHENMLADHLPTKLGLLSQLQELRLKGK